METVPGLTRAARHVLALLCLQGPLSPGEIRAQLDYSERGVRNALRRLESCGHVTCRIDTRDTRYRRYVALGRVAP